MTYIKINPSLSQSITNSLTLDQMEDFQGNIKTLDQKGYDRLKKSIIKNGIIAPFTVWDDHDIYRLLNGNQTKKILLEMQQLKAEYNMPERFPVIIVTAETEKEAWDIWTSITSQYGRFNKSALKEKIKELSDYQFMDNEIIIMDEPVIMNDEPEEKGNIPESSLKDGDTITFELTIYAGESMECYQCEKLIMELIGKCKKRKVIPVIKINDEEQELKK